GQFDPGSRRACRRHEPRRSDGADDADDVPAGTRSRRQMDPRFSDLGAVADLFRGLERTSRAARRSSAPRGFALQSEALSRQRAELRLAARSLRPRADVQRSNSGVKLWRFFFAVAAAWNILVAAGMMINAADVGAQLGVILNGHTYIVQF